MENQQEIRQKYKLWVTGMSENRTDAEVRAFCDQFGPIIHMARAKNQVDIFLTYSNDEVAAEALLQFRKAGIRANYAIDRNSKLNSSQSSSSSLNRNEQRSSRGPPQQPPVNQRRVQFLNVSSSESSISNDTSGMHQSDESSDSIHVETEFRNGDNIFITHVTDDLRFYAHLQSQDHDYVDLIKTVSKLAKDAEKLNEIPRRGSFVFAQHNGDFWRALVKSDIKNMNDMVGVKLIDTGKTVEVPFNQLRQIFDELANSMIKLTYSFRLKDVTDGAQNIYAAKYFKTFVGSLLKIQSDKEVVVPKSKITLVSPYTKQNINQSIQECMKTFTVDDLHKKSAPIGTEQNLILVDDSKLFDGDNLITFIDKRDQQELAAQMEQIKSVAKIYEKYPPYTPSVDELCLVKYEEHWHRGVLDSIIDMNYGIVYLVDLQKSIEIDLNDVRKINEDLVKLPIISFTGMVDGFQSKIDSKNKRILIKKISGDDVVCDILDGRNGDCICLIKI